MLVHGSGRLENSTVASRSAHKTRKAPGSKHSCFFQLEQGLPRIRIASVQVFAPNAISMGLVTKALDVRCMEIQRRKQQDCECCSDVQRH